MRTELQARKEDAWMVLEKLKGKVALTTFEMSAKLVAEFVRDLPTPSDGGSINAAPSS